MYYEFDIDWKSMPLSFALIGEADIRSDQWWAKCRSTMLSQIRQHFSDDDIDEKEMLRWFEEFQHKYCERRGHRLVPTPTGTKLVKLAYEDLAPYRGLLETMSELENEVKKLPDLYHIYEVIFNVMDIYDNYCLDLEEALAPSPSQAMPTAVSDETDLREVGDAEGIASTPKDVASIVSSTDFSHMRSFTPDTAFDMSALYTFLVDEGVVDSIDERLFADRISHAHVNELWEIAGRRRKRNLMQCLFKMLAQEWYPREWISTCASNMGLTVKKLTNPTTSGATGVFEDKLRRVLRPPKSD